MTHLLKLDIEGHEAACLRPLPKVANEFDGLLPQYITMEYAPSKLRLLPWMHTLGHQRVKLLDQGLFMD